MLNLTYRQGHNQFLWYLLLLVFAGSGLSGCDKTQAPELEAQVLYSRSVEDLAKLISLDGLELNSVYWASGPIVRTSGESFFNEWWLYALLEFSHGESLRTLLQDCELLASASVADDLQLLRLSDNPYFTQAAAVKIYDACRFKSASLVEGNMLIDVERQQILLRFWVH